MIEPWLIYDKKGYERNKWFADRLLKELKCRLIIAEDLEFGIDGDIYLKYEGKAVSPPVCAVQRAVYPLLSRVLEKSGARVFNSARVSEICNDKRKTLLLAHSLNIPAIKTAFSDKAFLCTPRLAYPTVVKSADGHGGREVFMAKNAREIKNALDNIPSREVLFQETASEGGADKRVYVLGGRVLACVKRTAREGFKSNFSLGGRAELSDISPEEQLAVDKIVESLKPDFVGIDFIYHHGKPLLNEVEDVVGTRMLYALTDIDAAKLYGEYILNKH